MAYRNESLKANTLRSPVPTLQRDRGNWKWSAIRCALATINAQTGAVTTPAVVNDDLTDLQAVDLFLFLHDAPALLVGTQVYPTVTITDFTIDNVTTQANIWSSHTVAFVTDAANVPLVVAEGEQASGFTLTNNVIITGYPVRFGLTEFVNAGAGTDMNPWVQFLANSPVIEGRPEFRDATTRIVPIIVIETAYTQAIRDNGNIYVDPVDGRTYDVVGLYGTVAA